MAKRKREESVESPSKKLEKLELQKSEKSDISEKPDNMLRFMSWNVNGARAVVKKAESLEFLNRIGKENNVIAMGLQETKCDGGTFPKEMLPKTLGWNNHYLNSSSAKKGYSGTCMQILITKKSKFFEKSYTFYNFFMFTRTKPISVKYGMGFQPADIEGRVISTEFEKFWYVTAYVPNSSAGLKRLDERTKKFEPKMREHLNKLAESKPVIYCGDLNVACSEIEIKNAKSNYNKSPGYTQAEIDEFFKMVEDCKMTDGFRHLYPDKKDCYTWWSYRAGARAKNVGWRLDYFMVDNRLKEAIVDVVHHTDVIGSDHCPIELILDGNKI